MLLATGHHDVEWGHIDVAAVVVHFHGEVRGSRMFGSSIILSTMSMSSSVMRSDQPMTAMTAIAIENWGVSQKEVLAHLDASSRGGRGTPFCTGHGQQRG
jgi:hypothetical protein